MKTLLWLMAVVAALFAGAEWQRRYGKQPMIQRGGGMALNLDSWSGHEMLTMPDGTIWFRVVYTGTPQGTLMFYGAQAERISVEAPPRQPAQNPPLFGQLRSAALE